MSEEGISVGDRIICGKCHGIGFIRRRFWFFSWREKCPRAYVVTGFTVNLEEQSK